MSAAFALRDASLDDLDQLVELVRLYYFYDHIGFEAERVRPALAELIGAPALGRVFLAHARLAHAHAHASDATAGYLVVTFGYDHEYGGRTALVTDLYVCDPFRRRGLGNALIEHAVKACRETGVHALELQVESDNDEARALYAKLGFRALERIPMVKTL